MLNPDGEADAATATPKTASGAVCQIIVSRRAVYGYDQRIEVFGSEGMVQSENQTQSHVRVFGKDAVATDRLKNDFIDRYAEAFVREIDVFLDAIEGKPAGYPGLMERSRSAGAQRGPLADRSGTPTCLPLAFGMYTRLVSCVNRTLRVVYLSLRNIDARLLDLVA